MATRLLSRALALTLLAILPTAALSENSVEDWSWKVDHFKRFGIWDSVCDHREDQGETLRRCYVSHVDVFAPRPRFAAAFVFVTPHSSDNERDDIRFEFRFEPGTRFEPDGFSIVEDDRMVWTFDTDSCPSLQCILVGAPAQELAAALTNSRELILALVDRYGRFHRLAWEAAGFAAALADMRVEAAKRDLME